MMGRADLVSLSLNTLTLGMLECWICWIELTAFVRPSFGL